MFLLLLNIAFTVANTGMLLRMAFKVKYALTSVILIGYMNDWIYSWEPVFPFSYNTNTTTLTSHELSCW